MGFARNWILVFCDPKRIKGISQLPRYFCDWKRYNNMVKEGKATLKDSYPCLSDRTATTPFDSHYFYQGYWLLKKLVENKPANHFDVGSSVLMIGVISAFVKMTFIEIRPLEVDINDFSLIKGDIKNLPLGNGVVPSISCLHVIEHIGLGRYGDQFDPEGSEKAARELTRVLEKGGRLLLATTIGRERTCFNAHRVFRPNTVLKMFNNLELKSFAYVSDSGKFYINAEPQDADNCEYACGMFEFVK